MIPFAEYAPDRATLESSTTGYVNNVIPLSGSYGPIKDLSLLGNALDARCQGAASFRGEDGTIVTFAGTATKLYLWDGSNWDDVTRSMDPYATPSEGRWTFTLFGNVVIANNGIDEPQAWTIGSSSLFADLAGSPPIARYCATIRDDFVVLAYLSSNTSGILWSSQYDPTAWTIGVNQSDEQDFQNKGRITGVVGGQYMVVFQERGITLGTYVGPDLIFQFDEISSQTGCVIPGSIANIEQSIIFASNDGFYRLDGGQALRPIGDERVARTFWDTVNQDYLDRCWSVIDQRTKLYYISYPSVDSSTGVPDRVLIYSLKVDRWAPGSFPVEVFFQMFADISADLDTSLSTEDDNLDYPGLPSFDSEIFFGSPIPKLAAFDTVAFQLGFFEGDNLAAEIETVEAELAQGRRAMVKVVRPMVDGGTLSVRLGTRNRPNDAVTYTSFASQNNSGECRFRNSAKQHRAAVMISSGSEWTHAQGVNFTFEVEGDR